MLRDVIICYSTCWACKFGHCFEPPQRHPWFDQEDIEYAAEAGTEPPSGDCACSCAKPTSEAP